MKNFGLKAKNFGLEAKGFGLKTKGFSRGMKCFAMGVNTFGLDTIQFLAILKSGVCMNTVTLSKEYQMNFPKEIFQPIGCEVGTSFEVITYNNMIELVPIRPMSSLRGMLKGIDTTIEREEDRL